MSLSRRIGFSIFMLALTVLFVSLGLWQMQRLAWKESLITAAETRAGAAPTPLPPAALWDALFPENYEFTPVSVRGEFAPDAPVLVFTALSAPKGPLGGPGHWVMHLFAAEGGGHIWVNRGFVPTDTVGEVAPPPQGIVTISGLMRGPEEAGWFTPAANLAARRDYVRDAARFPAPKDAANAIVAPFTIDLFAGEPGLPQAGETVLAFPNRHFEYALTWFALAAITPILLLIWLRRRG